MKVFSIIGSQRKNGNTANIVDLLNHKIQSYSNNELDINIKTMNLADQNIQMCKGCRICFNKGENFCPLKDDLLEIKKNINESDIIILSSPVYVEDVSGLVKNWIDRMAFISHRPEFFEKSAYILSTSGVGSTKHTLITMNTALRTWGGSIIGQDTFKIGELMSNEDINKNFDNRINKIAKKIVNYHKTSKKLKPTFLSLMIFKIQQLYYKKSNEKDSIDYNYWKNQNWLEDNRKYYMEIKSNFIKIIFARFFGSLIAKLVLK